MPFSAPLNYNQWLSQQPALDPSLEQKEYTNYILQWYKQKSADNSKLQKSIKEDYIQLLKDLSFLFNTTEKDQFLKDIDYTNDEELILAIPYFATKLKEVSKNLVQKRESVKQAKLKYNLIGSNKGLESLLYEYILKAFTKKNGSITQLPTLPIQNIFPELSSVQDSFYIEIEELYDSKSYHDSDPSVNIQEYVNLNDVINEPPFTDPNLTEDQMLVLLSTRFIPRVAPTPLSFVFNAYLSQIPTLSTSSLSASYIQTINNEIIATQKYMGETVYGLTAIRLSELNQADEILQLNITPGNNWFLWPSGNAVTTPFKFTNFFEPIYINNSNFVNSGATGGSDYTTSDLIFTDKNGIVEGAWLKGITENDQNVTIKINLPYGSSTEFLFPFVGFALNPKGFGWGGYAYNDDYRPLFNLLPHNQQEQLLSTYFTNSLPNSSLVPLYLNQTNLREKGHAGIFSDEGDLLTKQQKSDRLLENYTDANQEITEQAYLYKFARTDIPINFGNTEILWPVSTLDENSTIPFNITNEDCLPIRLSDTNPSQTVKGAIAGISFDTADVLYKLEARNGEATEAAWLRSGSTSFLDFLTDSIPVYDSAAVECAVPIEGPVQGTLSFKANAGEKVSFIWMGKDTPADEVFKFYRHNINCPYNKSAPHNYYRNQDYINPIPLKNPNPYTTCSCKSVNFSPIGHKGEKLSDYNSIADYLFADPQGLGRNFAINSWKDTRGYNAYNSPQFAFYKLDDNTLDEEIGWGSGSWKTGNGTPMILKTGRRYTYYRSTLKKGEDVSSVTPYYIINYTYPKINSILCQAQCSDIVFVLDASLSEVFNLNLTKEITKQIYTAILNSKQSHQIGLVSFKDTASLIAYLSKDPTILDILSAPTFSSGRSNLTSGLQLAKRILTTRIPSDTEGIINFFDLCRQLNSTIISNGSKAQNINIPQENCKKRIIVFSDGEANEETDNLITTLEEIKSEGIEVFSIDIGPLAALNENMENVATSESYYFNLQSYLQSGDGGVEEFARFIANVIIECPPIIPTWYKAIKQPNGAWIGSNELSDMVIRPGDYLRYNHRSSVFYSSPVNPNTNFTIPSITFTMNYKLDGWDYFTNSFSITSIGEGFGAKPFWGISTNIPNTESNFNKETITLGGNLRFFNDYTPIQQPFISTMILTNGNLLKYDNRGLKDLLWEQPLDLKVSDITNRWNKIVFYKDISNLSDLLKITNLETIGYGSQEPSNLLLESYSQFKPSKYNYYARNGFAYVENLYDANRCLNSFAIFNSAVIVEPLSPYANLDNRFYPTIASIPLSKTNTTEKQTGEYMLPDKLGVSTYRGRGYNMSLDPNRISVLESLSAEEVFLSIDKYGPRNRGLTKKDQQSPVSISNIDNRWIMEPYSMGDKRGIIIGTRENQKFTPYQTNYEIHNKNYYGLARQDDSFEFWSPAYPAVWNNPSQYPLTFRKELPASVYRDRIDQLFVNVGRMVEWKSDLFGFEYALYKQE